MDADDPILGMSDGAMPPLTPMPAPRKWGPGSIGYFGEPPYSPSAEEQLGDIRAALYRKGWMGPSECERPVSEVAVRAILERPLPSSDNG